MPRPIRGGSLALLFFMISLLIGRFATSNARPHSPESSQPPAGTPPSLPPAATSTPTPTRTPTPLPPTPTIQLEGTIILNQHNVTAYRYPSGSFVRPLRMVVGAGDEVYLLDTGQLKLVALDSAVSPRTLVPRDDIVEGVVMQELADISLLRDKGLLLLLDRAGNVFSYSLDDGSWRLERSVNMPGASGRQNVITVSAYGEAFYLLDSNVGEIWRHTGGQAEVISVQTDLRESADLAVGEAIFVLTREGYDGVLTLEKLGGLPLTSQYDFTPPSDLSDLSLLFLDQDRGGHLYVIDMGYKRLRLLDQDSGALVREYLFGDEEEEILSVYGDEGKLYLAGRDVIYLYPPAGVPQATPEPIATAITALSSLRPHDAAVLELLPPLKLPIEETAVSDMAFRLPGAPRSYRYGVHEGLDFYWAGGAPVGTNTAVLSVADGEVIRVDRDYVAPSAQEMEEMLAYTRQVYYTPADTLDALRGRQVWIDHGEGLVSRYCHLSAVADGLEVGQRVKQGQIMGYVGNSGTPASYYDQGSELHLHLEIRIGDGYLGQYLRPIDIKRWLEQVFGDDV